MTIVMVTHDPDIAALCQRIVRIKDGRIESDVKNGHGIGRGIPVSLPQAAPLPVAPKAEVHQ